MAATRRCWNGRALPSRSRRRARSPHSPAVEEDLQARSHPFPGRLLGRQHDRGPGAFRLLRHLLQLRHLHIEPRSFARSARRRADDLPAPLLRRAGRLRHLFSVARGGRRAAGARRDHRTRQRNQLDPNLSSRPLLSHRHALHLSDSVPFPDAQKLPKLGLGQRQPSFSRSSNNPKIGQVTVVVRPSIPEKPEEPLVFRSIHRGAGRRTGS